ncbi:MULTISPECIES: YpoC family protein [Bacillus]|uniref:YpoC family protein n=1 Tax=Bacillus TaxID=1386 RepID=UPI0003693285|nr:MULTISPECIES: hypothetical protein [Bacillus]
MEYNIGIPSAMKSDYFFGDVQNIKIDSTAFQNWNKAALDNFNYELLFTNEITCYHPWENSEEVIPHLFDEWRSIKEHLENFYSKRDVKKAAPYMKQAISISLSSIFWMNNSPVNIQEWSTKVESFKHVPVNFSERMNFILSRPNLYQSFKTIEQIINELEKIFAVLQIKKNNKIKKSSTL